MTDFMLTTTSFKDGDTLPFEQIYKGHGCDGGNTSPDLKWENAPEDTKSFAIIMHDPDAPVKNGWYHWIVLNIPKETTSLEKGQKIKSPMFETMTSFNETGYGGACPPIGHGVHHYNFKVYALDCVFDNSIKSKPPVEIEKEVESHSLASAKITAIYQR